MAEPVETPIGTVTAEHFRPGQVRHQVVAGPKFLYALFNPRDQMHTVARAFMGFVRHGELPYRRLIVNDHIVDEAATRLKKQASMQNAASFLTTLDESTLYQFEAVSAAVFADSLMPRTKPSLRRFSLMPELEVDHILTFDHHYDAFDVTTLPYRNQA